MVIKQVYFIFFIPSYHAVFVSTNPTLSFSFRNNPLTLLFLLLKICGLSVVDLAIRAFLIFS